MTKKIHVDVTAQMRRMLKEAAEKKGKGPKSLVVQILEEAIDDPKDFKNELKVNWRPDSDGTITVKIADEKKTKLREQARAREMTLRSYAPFLLKNWLERHGFAPPP